MQWILIWFSPDFEDLYCAWKVCVFNALILNFPLLNKRFYQAVPQLWPPLSAPATCVVCPSSWGRYILFCLPESNCNKRTAPFYKTKSNFGSSLLSLCVIICISNFIKVLSSKWHHVVMLSFLYKKPHYYNGKPPKW